MNESINLLKNDILDELSNAVNIEEAINTSIEMIGKYFNVDRVYIFENSEDDLCCSNTFEWCNKGITPEIDSLQNLRYLEDLGGTWLDNYDEKGLFFCPDVQDLPDAQKAILEPQGIRSMLQCSLKDRGEFKGYIGFDNCQDHLSGWEYDKDAIDALTFASKLLSIFLLEYRSKEKIVEYTEKLEVQQSALSDALNNAKEASKAKGVFLSNMSHEIRTPLNAIIGYLSLADEDDLSFETVRHYLDNSLIASKQLLQIINDILDISSIESGKMKIANEEYCLKKEIGDITTIFYQNAKMKDIDFTTSIDGMWDEWVIGDQLRVNQVLNNLLSNAVKFTPAKGSINLSVKQIRDDDQKVYFSFKVSDSGIGMSEEYMSNLFTPFVQESATTAKKYGGSGLGLSITKNLIDMMGGTIDVESVQGQGTTFTVTLHFGKAKNQNHADLSTIDYSHIRALVVDDQENEGSYVKEMLKRCGVKSDSVTSGTKAIKRIRSRISTDYKYDLCILDWNMPDMNGVEVATKIREEFNDDIPIIIATAYDVNAFEEEAKQAGVNKVIAKPLFQSTLFDLLVNVFGKYQVSGKKPEKSKIDMKGMRVILAEDNEMNMEIACSVLEKVNVKVDKAVNGKEAYDIFVNSDKGTYDLILMDVQMPIMDGYEATKLIRNSKHPEAKTMPVVAMTANAFAEDIAEALSKGMNAHISKPINYDKLFEVLQQFKK